MSTMTPVQLTEKYLAYRVAHDVQGILAICADNIELHTTKPLVGTTVIKGKDGLEGYLNANKGGGTWEVVQDLGDGTTNVKGKIEFAGGAVALNADATFSTVNGQITKIVVLLTV